MGFFYTKYLYPIKKKKLSSELGYIIDNPRADEIDRVTNHIKLTYRERYGENPPALNILSPEFSIKNIASILFNNGQEREELKSVYEAGNYFEFLARIQIIIRYDENVFQLTELEEKQIEKKKDEWEKQQDIEYPYTPEVSKQSKAREALESYGFLMASLLNDFEYALSGFNTILTQEPFRTKIDKPIEKYFVNLSSFGFYKNPQIDQDYIKNHYAFGIYELDQNKLYKYAKLINSVIEEPQNSKILYVADILKTCHKSFNNLKIQCVQLVSILELLLTHSPDFRRFNVEDSINKQFQLKVSICLNKSLSDIDLFEVKENLSRIYSIRSAISHGNFERLKKLHAEYSNTESVDGFIFNYVTILYEYVIEVIKMYLTDKEYVDFLKNS